MAHYVCYITEITVYSVGVNFSTNESNDVSCDSSVDWQRALKEQALMS